MTSLKPRTILLIGFFLVFLGVLLPWLTILHILESTFFLNFLAAGASVAGLLLGLVGAAWYVRDNRK